MISEAFRKIHMDGDRKICGNCCWFSYLNNWCYRYNTRRRETEQQASHWERGVQHFCDFKHKDEHG